VFFFGIAVLNFARMIHELGEGEDEDEDGGD
jgi:hypothetical protein